MQDGHSHHAPPATHNITHIEDLRVIDPWPARECWFGLASNIYSFSKAAPGEGSLPLPSDYHNLHNLHFLHNFFCFYYLHLVTVTAGRHSSTIWEHFVGMA